MQAALPAVAAVWFIAMTATSAPAFTLSAHSLDKPVGGFQCGEGLLRLRLARARLGLGLAASLGLRLWLEIPSLGLRVWLRLEIPSLGLRLWLAPSVGLPLGLLGSSALYLTARRSEASRAHLGRD